MTINTNKFKAYKDMFNIYNLITKIDNGYKLYFNNQNKNFYILNTNKNNEICMQFNTLSKNILKELRFSRIENLDRNLKFIEEFNENLSTKIQENTKQKTVDIMQDYCHYFNRSKT